MQTMTALLRVGGSLEMTVQMQGVTPAEALLLMHVHDPATKDAFEQAVLTADVKRSKTEERARLHEKYPQHTKLVDHLFPGRNASDVPDTFAELQEVPLEVVQQAKKERARAVHEQGVQEAPDTPQAYPTKSRTAKQVDEIMGGAAADEK